MASGEPQRTVGLIAGNGKLPFYWVSGAKKVGARVVVVGLRDEVDPALAAEVDVFEQFRPAQLGRHVEFFKKNGVVEFAWAGGIHKMATFKNMIPDAKGLKFVLTVKSFKDDLLQKSLAAFYESEGLKVISQGIFLEDAMPGEGVLTGKLSKEQEADAALGREIACAIGAADVGQCVVVHKGHVLALEAAEGTDACIRRGAQLGGPGTVVVKWAKPQQDLRFDLPTIGLGTIDTLAEVKASVLVVEAGKTILIDPPAVIQRAKKSGISIAVMPSR